MYLAYLKAIGLKRVALVSVVMVLGCCSPLFTSIWLSIWTGDPIFKNSTEASNEVKKDKMVMYLTVFSCSGVVGGENY